MDKIPYRVFIALAAITFIATFILWGFNHVISGLICWVATAGFVGCCALKSRREAYRP